MRKKHKRPEEEDAKVDMTPMLDIVFIMLIFFIVTTSFVKETGIIVNRPEDNKNTQSTSKNLSVSIGANGMIIMNGRVVDIERVTANIQTFLAENNTDTAVIQAEEETPHGTVVEVMDQIKIAGIDKLSVMLKK